MEKTNSKDNSSTSSNKQTEKTLRTFAIITVISVILSIFATGLSIYGAIQANRALSNQEKEVSDEYSEDDFDEMSFEFKKPTDADSIDGITIVYNDGNNEIEVYDGSVVITSYKDEENYTSDSSSINTKEIFQYIIDNDLDYLGSYDDYENFENVNWSLDITSKDDTYSYAAGEGETPAWLNTLIEKIKSLL